jgi:hypothetical protein
LFWRIIYIFSIVHLLAGASALAQTESDNSDRESFYRRQALRDLGPVERFRQFPEDEEKLPEKIQDLDTPTSDIYVSEPGARVTLEAEKKNRVRFKEPQKVFASPAQRETYKIPGMEPPAAREWGFGLGASSGYSSNVARFEGAPDGSFFDFTPNVFWGGRLGERMEFDLNGEIFFRTFNDEEINDVFRTFIGSANGNMTYFLSETWFFGLSGGTTQFDGREIDFTTPNNDGRDSQLSINNFEFSLGREWTKSFFAFSVGQEYVRGLTTVVDEFGNEFFPDLNQTMAGFRVGKQFSRSFRWEAGYQFKYREFLDQRARLDTGRVDPNFPTAPRLEEAENSVVTTMYLWDFLLEGGVDFTNDLVTGAMNRQTYHGTLILPFEVWGSVLLRPEAGIRFTTYDNFIGQIFRDLNATQLRDDSLQFYGAELIVDLGMVDPVVTYRRTVLESTFNIINFQEDFASVGIQASF